MDGHEPTAGQAGAARVMLVDDSAVVRGLMRRWIGAQAGLSVVGTAANGAEAIELARKVQPDLIVLDLEMPVMDGMTALPHLLQAVPKGKILVASTLSTRNAKISLQAMSLGATDYVAKPGSGSISRDEFERDLLAKLRALGPKRPQYSAQPWHYGACAGCLHWRATRAVSAYATFAALCASPQRICGAAYASTFHPIAGQGFMRSQSLCWRRSGA